MEFRSKWSDWSPEQKYPVLRSSVLDQIVERVRETRPNTPHWAVRIQVETLLRDALKEN